MVLLTTPLETKHLHTLRRLYYILSGTLLLSGTTLAQTTIVTDSATIAGTTVVIAGKHFEKSGIHNVFMGKHYRKEWTTPVRVPNFMLDTVKGGLTVQKEGGSRQTSSLRVKDKRGKEYVLRSIDKDFSKGMGEIFDHTMIGNTARDQASIGHPYAAPAIAALITPTGIYHTNPIIVFVPKQSALGEYNEQYGDQLYLFEERPDEDQRDAANFGNAKNVIGTDKLFEKIYEDHDNQVDQYAYAKARLFDMLIGDWSRHEDQWRWAEFKMEGRTIYKPIPRDRDQAFTQFDGFWPWVATNVAGATWLESFDKRLNKPKNFNTPGYQLDKVLLNELSQKDWLNAADDLKHALTDQVIENAMRQMPPAIYAISGENIVRNLKSRRDELDRYARFYYNYLSHHADLHGSDKRELFEIDRTVADKTTIRVSTMNKEGEVRKPYYTRTFTTDETKEIRIYGLAGTDVFRMTGDENNGVKVRVVDEQGNDSIEFSKGGRNKISVGNHYEYDTTHQKKFDFFILPFLSPKEYIAFANDPMDLFTRTGLKISANIRYNTKPWRKDEYENIHLISANYGFLRNAINVAYVGRFQQTFGKWDLMLKVRGDILAQENFFGIGNETQKLTDTRHFYNVTSQRLYGGVGVDRQFNKNSHLEATAIYQSVKVDSNSNNRIKGMEGIIPDIFRINRYAGAEIGYSYKNIDNDVYPTRGIRFGISGGFLQSLNGPDRFFTKWRSEFSFYIPVSNSFTFASRVGGGVLFGDADYYHLNILGGNENLRGYVRERFYGKHALFNNNEIRFVRPTRNIFYNGKIGLIGFFDNGRVWQPGEISSTWHIGYGGGLILIPFNRMTFTGTYGRSKEGYQVTALASVFF